MTLEAKKNSIDSLTDQFQKGLDQLSKFKPWKFSHKKWDTVMNAFDVQPGGLGFTTTIFGPYEEWSKYSPKTITSNSFKFQMLYSQLEVSADVERSRRELAGEDTSRITQFITALKQDCQKFESVQDQSIAHLSEHNGVSVPGAVELEELEEKVDLAHHISVMEDLVKQIEKHGTPPYPLGSSVEMAKKMAKQFHEGKPSAPASSYATMVDRHSVDDLRSTTGDLRSGLAELEAKAVAEAKPVNEAAERERQLGFRQEIFDDFIAPVFTNKSGLSVKMKKGQPNDRELVYELTSMAKQVHSSVAGPYDAVVKRKLKQKPGLAIQPRKLRAAIAPEIKQLGIQFGSQWFPELYASPHLVTPSPSHVGDYYDLPGNPGQPLKPNTVTPITIQLKKGSTWEDVLNDLPKKKV